MNFHPFLRQPLLTLAAVASIASSFAQTAPTAKRLSDYVNPFIGATTNTSMARAEHGLGKTFPGAATPWGMTQVSPNTITGGDNGSGYSYEHTASLFDRVEIALDPDYADAPAFVITATRPTPDACYISSATLNGKPYNRCYITHRDITGGGELHFELSADPNPAWGVE